MHSALVILIHAIIARTVRIYSSGQVHKKFHKKILAHFERTGDGSGRVFVCAGLSLEVIVIFSVQPESSKNNKPNQKIVDDMSTRWDFFVNVLLCCVVLLDV